MSTVSFKSKGLWMGLLGALTFAYPFILFLNSDTPPGYTLMVIVIGALIGRAALFDRATRLPLVHALSVAVVMGALYLGIPDKAPLFFPVVMNLAMTGLFAISLISPPTLIEQLARLNDPHLDEAGVRYTQNLTIVWAVFCLVNAGIASLTIYMDDLKLWMLYNGCISYILIATLLTAEYIFRQYYKAKHKRFIPVHDLLASKTTAEWVTTWQLVDQKPAHFTLTIQALMLQIQQSQAKRVFLIARDKAYFLAGFLASLQAGTPVVLPQSDAPGLLTDLLEESDLLLVEDAALLTLHPNSIHLTTIRPTQGNIAPFPPIDPATASITFYTSGTTGKPKPIHKSLKQLEDEITILEELWGSPDRVTFLSTIPHHHIYGLLFSLLWPVSAGYRLRESCHFWEELMNQGSSDHYLISSPAHLGRFPSLEGLENPTSFTRVFSSGGPLPFEAAQLSQRHLKTLPTEVYGSTETGGIAYRQQEEKEQPWQRFPGIELHVGADNRLSINSTYLPDDVLFETDDVVTLRDENTFILQGRADRIVKIEGKRVSLAEIESRLISLISIDQAIVVPLEDKTRDTLGALLVLSPSGKQRETEIGKVEFIKYLRQELHLYFDPVILPRKWRFMDYIPCNKNGKTPYKDLEIYFDSTR